MVTRDLKALRRYLLDELGIVEVADCTDEELVLVARGIDEMGLTGKTETIDQIVEEDFVRPPPSLEEFLYDPYYLGGSCSPTESSPGLFPKWKEVLAELFRPGANYKQLILAGGIGLGKSFLASVVILYKLARALLLRSPLTYYGMIRSTTLTFSYFSITQAQVIGGTFNDTVNLMLESPFFTENIRGHNSRKRYTDGKINLVKNCRIEAGSQIHEALGRNTLVSLIDEINFRREKNAFLAAAELLNAIEKRYKSRFRHVKDGLIILISSAKAEADFLASHIKKMRNDPTVMVCDYPWWEVAGPSRIRYSGKKFAVDIGDNISPAAIVQPDEVASVPAHRLINVPIEHHTDFTEDLDRAIRDVAGVSTGRTAKLFSNALPVINCIRDGVLNPFKNEIHSLSLGSPHSLVDCLVDGGSMMYATHNNRLRPRRNPNMPRYLHIDISSGAQDRLGMAMVHPVARKQVERTDLRTQMKEIILQPVLEADFVLGIKRQTPRDPIDFGKIRSFIVWLRSCGYNIQKVTCDLLLLSQEMRSILKKMGFREAYLSVDRVKDPYEVLRYAVLEGRVRLAPMDTLMMELMNLEDGDDKVDHPPKFNVPWVGAERFGMTPGSDGSKDMSDALCGAVYSAITDSEFDKNITLPELTEELADMANFLDPKSRLDGFIPRHTEVMVIE